MIVLTLHMRDRDNHKGRTYWYVRSLSLSALQTYAETLPAVIAGISDARIEKITMSYGEKLRAYVPDGELSGTFDRNGLFLGNDTNGNISSVIIPAIRQSMVTQSGTMSGVLLAQAALTIMNQLNSDISLYNRFGLPIVSFSTGGVAQ